MDQSQALSTDDLPHLRLPIHIEAEHLQSHWNTEYDTVVYSGESMVTAVAARVRLSASY